MVNTFATVPIFALFVSGHSAVIMFFLLSGFVLTLPFVSGKKIKYGNFIIRRILRIYVPFSFAIILSSLLRLNVSDVNSHFNPWFDSLWSVPINLPLIVQHFFLIGGYNTDALDPVIWTLVHEMRISFIFPLFIYLVIKLDWKRSLIIGFSLSCIGSLLYFVFNIRSKDFTYFMTIHYTLMFIVGAILAKEKKPLTNWIKNQSIKSKVLLFIVAILAYTYPNWFLPHIDILHLLPLEEWFETLGSSIFIMMALSVTLISKMLKNSVIHFLGKISYSLYLVHLPIIIFLIYELHNFFNLGLILLISIITSVVLATLMFNFVEKPSIILGKFLCSKLFSKKERTIEV